MTHCRLSVDTLAVDKRLPRPPKMASVVVTDGCFSAMKFTKSKYDSISSLEAVRFAAYFLTRLLPAIAASSSE